MTVVPPPLPGTAEAEDPSGDRQHIDIGTQAEYPFSNALDAFRLGAVNAGQGDQQVSRRAVGQLIPPREPPHLPAARRPIPTAFGQL